jgi:Tol biopolymer transport system component
MAAPVDLSTQRVTGPALTLVDQSSFSGPYGHAFADMAKDGSIVYISGALRRQAVLVGPGGHVRSLGEPGFAFWPRFSTDAQQVAWSAGNLSQRDLWVLRMPAGTPTRLTFGPGLNDRPEWSRDGSTLYFRSSRGPRHGIWSIPAAGGNPTPVYSRSDSDIDEGVPSPDGRHLIVQRDSTGNGETWVVALDGSNTATPVVAQSAVYGVYGGRFSPDGNWVVYTTNETSSGQVFVKPFGRPGLATQVSLNGGGTPVWAPDGKKIYYVNGEQLIAATIGGTSPFSIASRQVVLSRGYNFLGIHADFDVARDGTIIAFQPPSGSTQLVVVRNIAAELKARVLAAPK